MVPLSLSSTNLGLSWNKSKSREKVSPILFYFFKKEFKYIFTFLLIYYFHLSDLGVVGPSFLLFCAIKRKKMKGPWTGWWRIGGITVNHGHHHAILGRGR